MPVLGQSISNSSDRSSKHVKRVGNQLSGERKSSWVCQDFIIARVQLRLLRDGLEPFHRVAAIVKDEGRMVLLLQCYELTDRNLSQQH